MIWTLFVLDFDGTYSLEDPDDLGVQPVVYLIPQDKIVEAQKCACNASLKFGCDSEFGTDCIGDYFEGYMNDNGIPFKEVGSIDLTFGERQVDYLVDYIAREIV